MTMRGDTIAVDYAGSSAQVDRGTNCTLNCTLAYTACPPTYALDRLTRRNEGSCRAISVSAPEGSILNARHPAAVSARHLHRLRAA